MQKDIFYHYFTFLCVVLAKDHLLEVSQRIKAEFDFSDENGHPVLLIERSLLLPGLHWKVREEAEALSEVKLSLVQLLLILDDDLAGLA